MSVIRLLIPPKYNTNVIKYEPRAKTMISTFVLTPHHKSVIVGNRRHSLIISPRDIIISSKVPNIQTDASTALRNVVSRNEFHPLTRNHGDDAETRDRPLIGRHRSPRFLIGRAYSNDVDRVIVPVPRTFGDSG